MNLPKSIQGQVIQLDQFLHLLNPPGGMTEGYKLMVIRNGQRLLKKRWAEAYFAG
ncbi:MAG: hypothetical protein Fur0032_01000 [Terrimicrobiaceae bacterium]